jgi:uncharacterized protein with NRDE domain
LTNYREESDAVVIGARSRGLIPNAWLKSKPEEKESTGEFARKMIEEDGVKGIGGFSLCYGFVQDVVKAAAWTRHCEQSHTRRSGRRSPAASAG